MKVKAPLITLLFLLLLAMSGQAFAASIAVTAAAALEGSFGLAVTMDGTTTRTYIRDNSPSCETVYRASFVVQKNDVDFVPFNFHSVFFAFMDTPSPPSKAVIRLVIGQFLNGEYFIRAYAGQNGALSMRFIGGTLLRDAKVVITVEVVQGDPGANNGILRMYRNGILKQERLDVKNDTLCVDHARFGAPSLIDTSTLGTYYLDDFQSFRTLAP